MHLKYLYNKPKKNGELPQGSYIQPNNPNFFQMKKFLILIFILVSVVGSLHAQQSPMYTLYMMNPFLVNPAIAGTHNYYQIRSNHRFQWAGWTDAPVTNSISAFGPHSKKDMGFGGTIVNDVAGQTSRTSISGVYAYNVKLTSDIRISMGLSAGLIQYKVDGQSIKLEGADIPKGNEQIDNAIPNSVNSMLLPDASAGVYVYASNFFAGFSANQLLNNKFNKTPDARVFSKLTSHFYLVGGYKYYINREWAIEPTIILKKVVPSPFQLELDCKMLYNNMLWGGIAFRTQESFSILMGYTYQKKIYFGYALDFAINDVKLNTLGSHELVIGINFNAIKKVSRKKK